MRFDILSLFPKALAAFFDESLAKKAMEKGLIEVNLHNLRDYADNKWKKVDDRPFGGGPGMVIMAEPVIKAIEATKKPGGRVIYLSPQGVPFSAGKAKLFAKEEQLLLLAGHYEGIDQRALDCCVDEEISLGDFVLTGGELAAAMIVDATMRYIPGVVGDPESVLQDSFESGMLDWPHYTRPEILKGMKVPSVLLSGDHAKIAAWREEEARQKTKRVRPDLLK